jgi:hypothetical protein
MQSGGDDSGMASRNEVKLRGDKRW